MSDWRLQFSSAEGVERASFESREGAAQVAIAVGSGYEDSVQVTMIGPDGTVEPTDHSTV